MKIIDEKGRLFGKINVIDFLVILFLISLTPMVYYGYKIFNAPPPPPPPPPPPLLQDYQTGINVYVLFKNLQDGIVEKIVINDKELDGEGRVIAEVLSIEKIESNKLTGGINTIVDIARKQVIVKMLINVNVTTGNQMLFKGEVISENKVIKFKTDKYAIDGIIVSHPFQEWLIVKVRFNGLIDEMVKLINKGDYDSNIAKVKDAPIIESQKSLSFYDYKEYRWLPYPSNQKDVTLSIEILCTKKDDGLFYYKNNPVKVGASFSFQTMEYDINGTIIGIEK
ncbi:MAG: DUF4330 domain-containing protein [Nitrospinae bacterium]|nr:DUF4330 domain-containing protein [Nitrospinota bacterium]